MVEPQTLQSIQPIVRSEQQIEEHNQQSAAFLKDLDFASLTPEEILRWAAETFPGKAVISTSFQRTGVAMIHMAATLDLGLRFATVDTLRLHPETYVFIERIKERYQCAIEVYQPPAKHVESMVERFGEYLFFDSKEKQEYCCQVRKSRPNDELLKTVDCWIAGLRRDQSSFRQENAQVASLEQEYGTRRTIFKLNPLATWTEEDLLEYTKTHDIPVHPLYAQGYPSFGCTICSTPIRPGEEKRAGRWRWFNEGGSADPKECGLHYKI
jgi:phosphoadenosine phosphosulfate reductase